MEIFATIVNGWNPLTILAKCFVLDVWQGFGYASTFANWMSTENSIHGVYNFRLQLELALNCFQRILAKFYQLKLNKPANVQSQQQRLKNDALIIVQRGQQNRVSFIVYKNVRIFTKFTQLFSFLYH